MVFFHILGLIIPTDELIFFGGLGIPPTRSPLYLLKIVPSNIDHILTIWEK
jgi:hypothetical protein